MKALFNLIVQVLKKIFKRKVTEKVIKQQATELIKNPKKINKLPVKKQVEFVKEIQRISMVDNPEAVEPFFQAVKVAAEQHKKGLASNKQKHLLDIFKNVFYNLNYTLIPTPHSSWIKSVRWLKTSQAVVLLTKKTNKPYVFPNVPEEKFLYFAIAASAGIYMWDYFGRNFSINPENWLRKHERKY